MRHITAAIAALFVFTIVTNSSFAAISSVKDRLVVLDDVQTENTFIGVVAPEEVARQFLKQNATQLGLNPELADLQYEATVRTAIGYHVRFQHMHDGMPVYASNVVVTLNRNLAVVTYVNSYKKVTGNKEGLLRATVKTTEAMNNAYTYLKLRSSPRRQKIDPMVLVLNGNASVIYRVRISAPQDKKYSWEMLIDGQTNKMLFAKDIAMNEKITATLFDPNPTVKSGKGYGQTPGYKDDNNADNDFFTSMLNQVEIPDVTKSGGIYQLNGKYATIVDSESPTNPNCTSTGPVMNFSRAQPCFDAVMVYYFIDKSMRYVNETLGMEIMPFQYTGGVKADPHGLNGDDNSHYDPSSGELAFGQGGIDDAQDHDVILHELGHGLHDWVTKGHLSQNQGLSEGSGDYWALSYARQFMKKDHVAYYWTFAMDGHNEFWPGRVANVAGNYPSAAGGQIHQAGQLWATVCMMVYDSIGKLKTDKMFWSALGMLSDSSNQQDAANAFVKAAQQISPSDRDTVVRIFRSKGYNVQ